MAFDEEERQREQAWNALQLAWTAGTLVAKPSNKHGWWRMFVAEVYLRYALRRGTDGELNFKDGEPFEKWDRFR
ncbi:MAG TPA: hypothetical protein VLX61_02680 [Anaerolineales bacterium]|nr:hypothetical protein [Anaerolineales bacterium]